MYKIKEAARRGSALFAAASLLAGIGASAMPALVSADALNPLTERSLSLSSSSPGWSYKDGSGNTTYAPPNSGANGQKTGNTFSFVTSSNADGLSGHPKIKGFTFQYCTTAAGTCLAPGDDGFNTSGGAGSYTRNPDDTSHSDLNVAVSSPSEISSSNWTTIQARQSGVTAGQYAKTPLADNSEGNFVVLVEGSVVSGWTMTAGDNETGTVGAGTATGRNNTITLKNSTGQAIGANAHVQVIFYGTNTNYITNPGSGAFFVKINDYSLDTDVNPTTSTHIVDGGVTVANVMNESISIQTKVLETMDFSVGTVDPDTLSNAQLSTASSGARTAHGQCDPILPALNPSDPHNVLTLGNSNAENSLETNHTYATHSFWRLSSNSSGGATVYYTGHTLTNTENDAIAPIGVTAAAPLTGTEQFGIALDNGTGPTYGVNYAFAAPDGVSGVQYESGIDAGITGLSSDWTSSIPTGAHNPQLAPLVPTTNYGGGTGGINSVPDGSIGTTFAFDPNADSSAVPIASEGSQVVNCVTGKMRYAANIAATTPAGIYTTKVNYVAAPQY